MSEETPKVEYASVKLVCSGGYYDGDRVIYTFRHLQEDGTLGKEDLSWAKVSGFPGSVYEVKCKSLEAFKDKGSIFTNTFKFVESWDNRDEAAKWQAELRSAEAKAQADKLYAKEKILMDEFRKRMKPIRQLYQKTNYQNKAALLGIVIRELQRPLDYEEED